MAMKKCPVCGVSVKMENLERHVRNQHPRDHVDLEETLTEEDRQELRETRAAARPGLTSGGRRLITIVAIVVAGLLVVIVAFVYFAPPPIGSGTPAPNFSLTSADGSTTVTLSAWKGGGVLIEFMDVDCPYCQQEAPVLAGLYSTYLAKGVHFVSVDINFEGQQDTPARIAAFQSQYGTSWPYCLDPGASVQHAYGVTSTPTIFIVNKSGIIYTQMTGIAQASQANLVAALNAVSG